MTIALVAYVDLVRSNRVKPRHPVGGDANSTRAAGYLLRVSDVTVLGKLRIYGDAQQPALDVHLGSCAACTEIRVLPFVARTYRLRW